MTQPYTPPPYPPYQPYPVPPVHPRVPFRRTSVLMFVLAGVLLLLGTCLGLGGNVDPANLPEANRTVFQRQDAELRRQTGAGFRQVATGLAVVMVTPAVLLVVTGVGVRAGRPGWIVAAIVVTGGVLGVLGLMAINTLLGLGRDPTVIFGALILTVPIVLFAVLMKFLLECRRFARAGPPYGYGPPPQAGYWPYPPPGPGGYPQGYPPPPPGYPQAGYGYGNTTGQQGGSPPSTPASGGSDAGPRA